LHSGSFLAVYSPEGLVSKLNSKWLAWLMSMPWAGKAAPEASATERRSSPERSCAAEDCGSAIRKTARTPVLKKVGFTCFC